MKRLARCMSAILVVAVSLAVLTACITVRVGPKSDGAPDGKGNRPGKTSDCPFISEVRNADGTIVTTYRILDDTLVFKENPADNTATIDSTDTFDYFELPDKLTLKKGADGSYTVTDEYDCTYTVSKGNDRSLKLKCSAEEYVTYAMVPDRDGALTWSYFESYDESSSEMTIAPDGWGYWLDPDNGGYVVRGTVNRDAAQLTIPSEFRGEAVTGIEGYAFSGCESLSSVTIPDSVTSIGYSAFSGTPWYDNQPDGVVYAGKVAYKYKGEMPENTKIELKSGTKTIGDLAFRDCGNLSLITIPAGVTSIGYSAFEDCNGLTSVTIPDSVTNIGGSAFEGCSSLASITIPDSVTSIGFRAFSGCTSLTSVTIPDSVESVGWGAFSGTPWYDNKPDGLIYFGDGAYKYKGEMPENTSVELREGTKTINAGAFSGCDNLTSVTIPSGVTSIEDSAFSGCTSLTSVTIPSSVTSIGDESFSGCEKLTSITIPAGVTSIGGGAFEDCTGLTSVTIPDSVTRIGRSAFSGCTSLKSITIPNSVTNIGNWAFLGCTSLVSVTIPDSVTSIGSSAFCRCVSLVSITIPSSVTDIGGYAFSDCSSLASITIPASVTNIGSYAFSGCTSLTSVTIPSSVTRIGSGVFSDCTSLTSIAIPSSVTSIGYRAFEGCSSLTSVTVPDSVTRIGENAFRDTPWYDNKPDGLIYIGSVAYEYKGEMPANKKIELKTGTKAIGQSAFSDCTSLTSITIPDSVSRIGRGAFSGCTSLPAVTIPAGVTSIGEDAFSGCTSLKNITIPVGVTRIGYCAFSGCSSLKSITIPNSVTNIGSGAFSGCTSLASITIPSSVTLIDSNAFSDCTSLASVTVPDSVESVGRGAFYGTPWYNNQPDGLIYIGSIAYKYKGEMPENTKIELKTGTKTINSDAFRDCDNLTSVTIPASVTSIGGAFYDCTSLEDIAFSGTKKQWEAIEKYYYGYGWHYNVPATVVHCSDGDVSIEEE